MSKLLEIPIDKIDQKKNTRGDYHDADIEEIMVSMRQIGLMQPVGVRKNGDKYEMVFGNRRLVAAKKLGWTKIDAVVVTEPPSKESDIDLLIKNAAENLQRKDPSFTEQGKIFSELIKRGLTVGEIAARIGISKIKVQRILDSFQVVPIYLRDNVVLEKTGAKKDDPNLLSVTNASAVINQIKSASGITEAQRDKLFQYAMVPGVTPTNILQVVRLVKEGVAFNTAKKYIGSVKVVSVNFLMVESVIKSIEKKYGHKIDSIIYEFVKDSGKFPLAKVAEGIKKKTYQNNASV